MCVFLPLAQLLIIVDGIYYQRLLQRSYLSSVYFLLGPMANGLAPLIIGFLVASIGFSFGGTTGFALNPARDFHQGWLTLFYQFQIKDLQI